MAPILRKIHRKTGSHNDSKIYSSMLKRVGSKSADYPYVIIMRQCQKSIMKPLYGFLASSCDYAIMDSVKLKILLGVNGNLIVKSRLSERQLSETTGLFEDDRQSRLFSLLSIAIKL